MISMPQSALALDLALALAVLLRLWFVMWSCSVLPVMKRDYRHHAETSLASAMCH